MGITIRTSAVGGDGAGYPIARAFYQNSAAVVAKGVFISQAGGVARVNIPEPGSLACQDCPFKGRGRGGVTVGHSVAGVEP